MVWHAACGMWHVASVTLWGWTQIHTYTRTHTHKNAIAETLNEAVVFNAPAIRPIKYTICIFRRVYIHTYMYKCMLIYVYIHTYTYKFNGRCIIASTQRN